MSDVCRLTQSSTFLGNQLVTSSLERKRFIPHVLLTAIILDEDDDLILFA